MTEVHAIWLEQDDPKKNTAVKLSKHNLVKLHKRLNRLPRRGIVLDPLCGKVLGPEDRDLIDSGGALVGLDCSWVNIESSVEQITKQTKLERRTLPLFSQLILSTGEKFRNSQLQKHLPLHCGYLGMKIEVDYYSQNLIGDQVLLNLI